MKINALLLKKATGIAAAAAITAQLLLPAISIYSPVEAYSLGEKGSSVTYTFEEGSFADGIAQDEQSLKTDGTSSELKFTDTSVAKIGGQQVKNSPISNVVGLANGQSRSTGKKYSSEESYPALALKHTNVLRLGADGSSTDVSGGVLLNNGESVLTLNAGKYIIGFDYYATSEVKSENAVLKIISNVSNYVNENGKLYIGTDFNTAVSALDGESTVTGAWQTVAYTVELDKTENIGFYAENLNGELFLDNITLSTVSTVSFDADCDIMPISGEPGTAVSLPDETDVTVDGKQFEGWYSDEALTKQVDAAAYTLPTNAVSTTLYAKMKKVASADTVAEFNFDSGDYADFKTAAVVDGTKVS